MSDEVQGPRVRKVTSHVDEKGRRMTAAVEVPVGYERRLTPAEERFVRALIRDAIRRDMGKP